MSINTVIRLAIKNLCINKMRFAQVMLSMVIGVAAIVVTCNTCRLMLNLMDTTWTPETFSVIHMYVNSRVGYKKQATIEDMERIAAENPEVIVSVSPYICDTSLVGNVRYGDKYYDKAFFIGVNEKYLDISVDEKLAEGRFIQHMDCNREQNVCVVSQKIADELMGGDALGKTLKVWGVNCTVVGVMRQNTAQYEDYIYLPYTNAKKITGDRISHGNLGNYYKNRFIVLANGVENIGNARTIVEQGMEELLDNEVDKDSWYLTCASQKFFHEQGKGAAYSTGFTFMLMAVIVLVVGGVGIMNVMLASVQERTKEIGIRKTFGATNKDIQRQFMAEAVITSLLGGVLGVVVGVILGFALPGFFGNISVDNTGVSYPASDLGTSMAAWPILLALGFAVLIGVIFGTYPAQRAAEMEIVDAINSD